MWLDWLLKTWMVNSLAPNVFQVAYHGKRGGYQKIFKKTLIGQATND